MGKIDTILDRISGQRVYIDANIFIYFLDRHPTYFDTVSSLFQSSVDQKFFATTGDIAVAEVMVGPYRNNDIMLITRFQRFFAEKKFLTVVAHDRDVFDIATLLVAQKRMKFIDALHIATALSVGCTTFITNDF